MAQMTACPRCAEPCEPEDLFCGGCGTGLVAPPAGPVPAVPGGETVHLRDVTARVPPPGAPPGGPPPPPGAPAGHHGRYGRGDASRLPPARPPAGWAPTDPSPARAAAPAGAARPDPRHAAGAPGAHDGPWAAKTCAACGEVGIDNDGYCEHCGHAQPRERDHMERALEGVAGVSDRGLRHHRNEDAFKVSATSLPDGAPAVVAVVCDGVSSATRPDEASAAAAEAATEALLEALESGTDREQAMHQALVTAAEAVNALSDGPSRDHNAPACTCVSAVAAPDSVTVGWIGDSRAYWIPDDREEPERLTEDDSWAARMVAHGLMSEADAYADERAHAITGWLGADAVEIDPHVTTFTPTGPGVVVVCTDGLWNYAESAVQLAGLVPPDARTEPLRSARHLVGVALDSGGHDNITVAVLPFPPAAGRTAVPPAPAP